MDEADKYHPEEAVRAHLVSCADCRQRLEAFRVLARAGRTSGADVSALRTPAIRAELARLFGILARRSQNSKAGQPDHETIPLHPVLPRNHYNALAADPGSDTSARLPVLRSAEGDYVVRFRKERDGRIRAYVIENGKDGPAQLHLRIGAAGPVFPVGDDGEADLGSVTESQIREAVVSVERRVGRRGESRR